VVSFATGGGFVGADYDPVPVFTPMWILLLSCVCCALLHRRRHQDVPLAGADQAVAARCSRWCIRRRCCR
jgi:hypothetical protein